MGEVMSGERESTPIYLDDSGFEGVRVINLEDSKPESWIAVGIDLLGSHRPLEAVALLTLAVLAIESYAIGAHWELVVVALVTVTFALFVIMIGRTNGRSEASSSDDAGVATQGERKVGEAQSGNGSESLGGDPPSTVSVRSRGGGGNGRQQADHPKPRRRKGNHPH